MFSLAMRLPIPPRPTAVQCMYDRVCSIFGVAFQDIPLQISMYVRLSNLAQGNKRAARTSAAPPMPSTGYQPYSAGN